MAQNFFLKEPAPTKVQVVNEDGSEVIKAEIENLPLGSTGSYIQVFPVGGTLNSLTSIRPNSGSFNLYYDNILILQSDGGFFAIPLNTHILNLTQQNVNIALAATKTAYATLVAGVTSATLHYHQLNSNGVVTSEVYDLKTV